MKKINVLSFLVLLAGTTFAQTTWTLDKPHTSVGFSATHMVEMGRAHV